MYVATVRSAECRIFQERIAILEAYVRTESSKEMRAVFIEEFPNSSTPANSTIQNLVAKQSDRICG